MLFIVVGCANNSSQHKEEAIKTYVNANNRLIDLNSFAIELNGDINMPKSALVQKEVNASISTNMIVDLKNFLMKIDMSIKSKELNENIKLYIDKNYVYAYTGGKWSKESIGEENVDINDITNQKMTYEQALLFFESFDSINYTKETINGVDGFTISGKVNLMKIINSSLKQQGMEDALEEIKEMEKVLKAIDLNYSTFVSNEENSLPSYKLAIKSNMFGVKVDLGPFEINMSKTNEKVVIPSDAKKAKNNSLDIEV